MREGPKLIQPPPYLSCSGCIHRRFDARWIGHDIVNERRCLHPSFTGRDKAPREVVLARAKTIGESDVTPDWCPIMTEASNA